MASFFSELKRRNVLRAGAFHAAATWLLVQIATHVFAFFDVPNWTVRWIEALGRLQRFVESAPAGQRFNGIRYLWLPPFDPVRADPRFKAILGKLGVPEQLAQGARP